MKKPTLVLLVNFLVPAMVFGILALREKPHVFSELSFAEAKAKAIEQEKILLVDITAVWCQPCKAMERTTWVDPEVVSWVSKNAIVIQVDVDKQQEEAKELNIQAMPTIIVFKGGRELDRVVGFQDAADLLAWLNR